MNKMSGNNGIQMSLFMVLLTTLMVTGKAVSGTDVSGLHPSSKQGQFFYTPSFYYPQAPIFQPVIGQVPQLVRSTSYRPQQFIYRYIRQYALSTLVMRMIAAAATTTATTTATTPQALTTTPDPFASWTRYLTCRYRWFYELKTYDEAKAACSLLGAELANRGIRTSSDLLAVQVLTNALRVYPWIGVENYDGDNTWNWLNGDVVDTNAFTFHDFVTGPKCGIAFSLDGASNLIRSFQCTDRQPGYICEKCD